ncbi:MAG: hypothetical protein EBW87_00950 [Burkholderiaceae bacterium]|nr:hypothetical protein [Burkholderiaceae bacterium]
MSGYSLGDYIQVNERILLAIEKFPEMTLQFEFKGTLEHAPDYIWGIAYLYRYPDDPRPAIGTAAELAIGKTNYTRGSEIQNLETSAWGRACAAAGIGLGKGVASADEVKFAKERQSAPQNESGETIEQKPMEFQSAYQMTQKQYSIIKAMFNHDIDAMVAYVKEYKMRVNHPDEVALTKGLASALIDELKAQGFVPMPNPKRNIDPESKWE